jgi:hypothetical protein
MIRPNELRIGNWVDGGKVYYKIQASDFVYTNFNVTKPIPLTPEILESAGFEREEDEILNVYSKKYLCTCPIQDSKPDHIDFKIYEDNYGNWYLYFEGAGIGNGFKYLHQLQNLYYTLTGHELTINLHATV